MHIFNFTIFFTCLMTSSCMLPDIPETRACSHRSPTLGWAFSINNSSVREDSSPLVEASCRNSKKRVEHYLANPDITIEERSEALYEACKNNNHDIMTIILQDDRFSLRWHDFAVVKCIFSSNSPNIIDMVNRRVLRTPGAACIAFKISCALGSYELVEKLSDHCSSNCTVKGMSLAIKNGHDDILDYLFSTYSMNYDPRVLSILIIWASEVGNLSALNYLLDSGLEAGVHSSKAFRVACRFGNLNIARRLAIESDISVFAKNNLALKQACQFGQIELVRYLLYECRLDPSEHDSSSLKYAAYCSDPMVTALLLEDPRVDPNANNFEAALIAFQHGNEEVLRLVLSDKRLRLLDCLAVLNE